MKQTLKIGLVAAGLMFSCSDLRAEESPRMTEALFKDVCVRIAEADKQPLQTDAQKADWRSQIEQLHAALYDLSRSEPGSIWADDAAYVAAMLRQSAAEMETFIKNYSKAKAEPWTLETLGSRLPKSLPPDLVVRRALTLDYASSGQTFKLASLSAESAKKYPNHKEWFSPKVNS